MFKIHLLVAMLLCLLYCPLNTQAQCVSTTVTSPNGTNPIRITVGDGIPDVITYERSDAGDSDYAYAITDGNFNILKVVGEEENSMDFDDSGEGACWVWGFSYTGDITAEMGDFVFRTQFSTGCWQISRTAISLIRTASNATLVSQLYASSNTQGLVGVYSIFDDNSTQKRTFTSAGADADGIFFDQNEDVVYQVDRSNNAVQAYSNVNGSGFNPMTTATSTSDFSNGRELAIMGDQLIVAQDANDSNGGNQFYIYDYSSTSFTLNKVYDADINLWGIHAEGSTLYAIEDNTNRLAIYENFLDQAAGTITATASIEIEGIVRTHGITYDAATDMMLLTDVGAASSPEDGTFTVIKNFGAASADGFVSLAEQIVVAGDATKLGNPVDIAYDDDRRIIFIAERANGGGRILGFSMPATNGNFAPIFDDAFAGASAVYFAGETPSTAATIAQVFASSNTAGTIGVFDVKADNAVMMSSFASVAADADGIFYSKALDVLYQVNRTDNVVNAYSTVSVNPTLTATSTADFSNGRELVISNGKLVVAQDANDSNGGNQFYIYNVSPTAIILDKVYDADINLWGMHAEGSTIYAIEDNTNRLAIYEDFFDQPEGAISATESIEIEGIVRTHGITYYAATDLMILTDVGAASSPDDGTFTVIKDFEAASEDGFVSLDEQIVVAGAATLLGNPVDIAYDAVSDMIFVAERANGGGRILGFTMPMASGNIAPNYSADFAGASAVYLSSEDMENIPNSPSVGNSEFKIIDALELYPNPVSDVLTLNWEETSETEQAVLRIFNLSGQQVHESTMNAQDRNRMTLNVDHLPSGIYQVVLEQGTSSLQQRFVKQ
ncbi:MAG: T9SS type A sorting domain-containing protein [Bacteroidota bacterium]